ncbi:MAG TPA: toll/interleukin-1 receptor domain-containing protein [Solirubrobacterales bacterium]
MKVFISHSSTDKWIARQIARELETRGINAFLDEKDIQTGDSIEDAVGAHLAESDELLMLLSPASLDSSWVLIEIGGAKALGKRLVPILHHVGPNELPAPLAGGLARDLNDIERYYQEVQTRSELSDAEREKSTEAEAEAEASSKSRAAEAPSISKGDRVKLPMREPSSTVARDGRDIGWNLYMADLLGAEATVLDIDEASGVVHVDLDHGRWLWLLDWLTPIAPQNS